MAQQLCESQGGHPELPVPSRPSSLCEHKAILKLVKAEFRSCVKVEVTVLDSPPLIISLMVSVDMKQH